MFEYFLVGIKIMGVYPESKEDVELERYHQMMRRDRERMDYIKRYIQTIPKNVFFFKWI